MEFYSVNKSEEFNPENVVLEINGIGVWNWDLDQDKVLCNERWAEMVGYSLQELHSITSKSHVYLIHPDDFERLNQIFKNLIKGNIQSYETEFRMKHKLGHYIWILAAGKILEPNLDHQSKRLVGTHVDITQRKLNEQELTTTSYLLEQTQKIAQVGGWELDITTGDLYWTDETFRILDTSRDEYNPSVDSVLNYFLPESKRQLEMALATATTSGQGYDLALETHTLKGRKIDVRATCMVTFKNNTPVKLTGIFQDISEQKVNQRRLEESNLQLAHVNKELEANAYYDALTGLPNRNLLADRMMHSIQANKRKENHIAIAFMDLDGFKEVNDLYGHGIGDELLRTIANKIKHLMRDCDTLSRFGGDEFVMIIDGLNAPDECHSLLQRILDSVSAIKLVKQKAVNITASIGVTIYPQDDSNSDQLIRHADQAMYIAKQSGKNCFHIFDVVQDFAVTHQYGEQERIRAALINDEFVLYFQPKINIKTNKVIGLEALIRWIHPQKGLLLPLEFLPIIEHHKLIVELGEWVIKQALNQVNSWYEIGIELPISVNISPLQIQQANFVERLEIILQSFPHFKSGMIEFEILETSSLNDLTLVIEVIEKCHERGITFAVDDFGTGYSSLTYLKKLPTEYLKIDRSFVRDMLSDKDDLAIVQGVIQLAKTFERTVIAEGVETIEHGQKLLSLECHLAQGFGISKPMPATEFPNWLNSWKQKNLWQKLSQSIT